MELMSLVWLVLGPCGTAFGLAPIDIFTPRPFWGFRAPAGAFLLRPASTRRAFQGLHRHFPATCVRDVSTEQHKMVLLAVQPLGSAKFTSSGAHKAKSTPYTAICQANLGFKKETGGG